MGGPEPAGPLGLPKSGPDGTESVRLQMATKRNEHTIVTSLPRKVTHLTRSWYATQTTQTRNIAIATRVIRFVCLAKCPRNRRLGVRSSQTPSSSNLLDSFSVATVNAVHGWKRSTATVICPRIGLDSSQGMHRHRQSVQLQHPAIPVHKGFLDSRDLVRKLGILHPRKIRTNL